MWTGWQCWHDDSVLLEGCNISQQRCTATQTGCSNQNRWPANKRENSRRLLSTTSPDSSWRAITWQKNSHQFFFLFPLAFFFSHRQPNRLLMLQSRIRTGKDFDLHQMTLTCRREDTLVFYSEFLTLTKTKQPKKSQQLNNQQRLNFNLNFISVFNFYLFFVKKHSCLAAFEKIKGEFSCLKPEFTSNLFIVFKRE